MKLYQFIAVTVHPYEVIKVFDRNSGVLYISFDFIVEYLKKGFTYEVILNSFVTEICLNGDFIQCEVIFNE